VSRQADLGDLTPRQLEALPPVMQWRKLLAQVKPAGSRPSVPIVRSVGGVLANHADRLGGSCWPSLATIASEAGANRRSVLYALRELENAGLLERKRRGGHAPTCYRLVLPQAEAKEGAHIFPQPVERSVESLGTAESLGAPAVISRCTGVHPRSALRSAQDQELVVGAPPVVENSAAER
jgi:hypothetical protein